MKKGCFFTAIFLFTLIVGGGFYVYKKYGHKFKEYSKEKIIEFAFNELDKKIEEVENSNYRDSLIVFLEKKRTQFNENAIDEYRDMFTKIKYYINDGKIDSVEFYTLKMYDRNYERSEKN